jgi:hypothetical protein
MNEISKNLFRTKTKHKKVVYKFKSNKGDIKTFESDKFYCNDYKGILSMPKFSLSNTGKFYEIEPNKFLYVSEFGETSFEVVSNV